MESLGEPTPSIFDDILACVVEVPSSSKRLLPLYLICVLFSGLLLLVVDFGKQVLGSIFKINSIQRSSTFSLYFAKHYSYMSLIP